MSNEYGRGDFVRVKLTGQSATVKYCLKKRIVTESIFMDKIEEIVLCHVVDFKGRITEVEFSPEELEDAVV